MRKFTFRRRPKAAPGPDHFRPRIETLENRTLLSVNVGLAKAGLNDTRYVPPDTVGAIGPNHFVEAVNLRLGIYNKATGNFISNQDLTTFFNNGLGGVLQGSDPVVTYDTYADKFVVGMIDYNGSNFNPCRFDLAVSNTSDPTGSWTFQRYDMTTDSTGGRYLSDYPKLGYNADAYVVSFNMFPEGGGSQHVDTLSISRSSLAGFVYAWPTGTVNLPGMAPAVVHDGAPGDPVWLVGTGSGSNIKVLKMTNELSNNPATTSYLVSVDSYSAMTAPRQPGGSNMSWTFDTRIFNAAMRNNLLVAAHAVKVGSNDVARWYELDTSGSVPTLIQQGNVNPGGTADTYFPTIDINTANNLGMTFIESSTTEYMSMYVTGRTDADPLGQMETPVNPAPLNGTSRYTLSRAGDYSAITVDPSDGLTFWAANEYKGSATYNTGFASFSVSSSAATQFAVYVSAADPDVAGTFFDVTVVAVDPSGNVDPNYTGTVTFSSGDPYGASLPADYTFQPSDQGQVTFYGVTALYTAGTWDVTATDTVSGITGSAFVNVQAAPAVGFQVIAPTSTSAGAPFDVTVVATDPYGNTDTNYSGTITFSSQDPAGATLPPDYTFQPGDQGAAFFPAGVTLYTPGTWDVTVTDTSTGITGVTYVDVTSGAVGGLGLRLGGVPVEPANQTPPAAPPAPAGTPMAAPGLRTSQLDRYFTSGRANHPIDPALDVGLDGTFATDLALAQGAT